MFAFAGYVHIYCKYGVLGNRKWHCQEARHRHRVIEDKYTPNQRLLLLWRKKKLFCNGMLTFCLLLFTNSI